MDSAQTLERIFSLCSAIALAGWIMLLTAPFARAPLIRGARILSGVLAIAYVVQIATIVQPVAGGGFSTLAGVVALFSMPGNVMLGWTHYLAFDLFTGAWALEDSARIGIPHWAMIVPLALTFLLGPVGLLTYGIIRTLHLWRTRGRWV
ncbi:MAG: ABA4-like family protein [Sphingomonadales bacterium]